MRRLGIIESLIVAIQVYRDCRKGSPDGLYYLHHDNYGIADTAILFGIGREAWRISQVAIEAFPNRS